MPPRHSPPEIFVERRYKKLLKSYDAVGNLIKLLNLKSEVFIFGGWVRDRIHEYFHNGKLSGEDIDLVINGKIDEQSLPKVKKNIFWGGFELNKKKTVHFWQLDKTFAFREKFFKPSVENLLRSTVFTVNSVVFNTKSFQLRDYLAVEDISRRMVKFNCRDYLDVFPGLQVFRAMKLVDKLGYKLDSEVEKFICAHLKKTSPIEFLNSVLAHKKGVSKQDVKRIYAIFKSQL